MRRNLRENDVVLVIDDQTPRGSWPLGRVMKVFRGKDDVVRSAVVKTQFGEYHWPISKMCMLLEAETDVVEPV